jgi:hypothetical protein
MTAPAVGTSSRQVYARVAGCTMLLYMVVGFLSVNLYAGALGSADSETLLAQVAAHAPVLRTTIVLEMIECFAALVLAVTLYAVTRVESEPIALLGLVGRVAEGILAAVGIRTTLSLLWLAGGSPAATGMPGAGAMGSFLLLPGQSTMLGAPFFALGSLAFSWLLLRGRMVPTPLAWLGVAASGMLLIGVPLQLAAVVPLSFTAMLWLPMVIFQLPLGVWLLLKGVSPAASTGTG